MGKFASRFGAIGTTLILVFSGAAFVAACQSEILHVSAHITQGLTVSLKEMNFGVVFPQEKLDKTLTVGLAETCKDHTQSGGNLVKNGSFEAPIVYKSAKWDIFKNGTLGLVWTAEWVDAAANFYNGRKRPKEPGMIELQRGVSGWQAADGLQYAELDSDWFGPNDALNGEPALIKIRQDLITQAGQAYILRFKFSPRPGTGNDDNILKVMWGGTQIADLTLSGVGKSGTDWQAYSYPVKATGQYTRLEFVGGGKNNSLGVFLDDVSVTLSSEQGLVDYYIRQKPKCQLKPGTDVKYKLEEFGLVKEVGNTFVCEDSEHYQIMPLLCPYLSKHEVDSAGNVIGGIGAFHGQPGAWTPDTAKQYDANGSLSAADKNTQDTWNIDLAVPCFTGQCAQDWPDFVHANNPLADPAAYTLNPSDEGKVFGCDLWVDIVKK
jgi:hypothetical protein